MTTNIIRPHPAIGIIRVSSAAQEDRYGPQAQEADIKECAARLGLDLVDTISYQEAATNADHRPRFAAILDELGQRATTDGIRTVIFGRPDRLGRDGEDNFFYYLRSLERAGNLVVRFARDDVEPDDEFRAFKLFLHAFKARLDAKTIRANTMSGRRVRAQSGLLPNGQVRWPFDYQARRVVGTASTGKPTINPERAAWVKRWFDWLLIEKTSLRTVCKRMEAAGVPSPRGSSKWSPSTVTRILSDRSLMGEFYAYKKGSKPALVIQDPALAIATPAEFEGVQAILTQNRQLSPRNVQHDYTPLRGMVSCQCGRKAAGCPSHGHLYFRCQICRKHPVNAQALWREVRKALERIFLHPETFIELLNTDIEDGAAEGRVEAKLDAVKKEVSNLDRALERAMRMHLILDGYEASKLEDEVTRIRKLRREREDESTELELQLANARRSRISQLTIRDRCARYAASLGTLSDQDWVLILRELDLRVVIGPELPYKVHAMIPVQLAPDSAVVLQPSRTMEYRTGNTRLTGSGSERSTELNNTVIAAVAHVTPG